MTFREKHLWITVMSTVLVWGFYYVRMYEAVAGGGLMSDEFPGAMGALFAGCLIVVVVIEIVLNIIHLHHFQS